MWSSQNSHVSKGNHTLFTISRQQSPVLLKSPGTVQLNYTQTVTIENEDLIGFPAIPRICKAPYQICPLSDFYLTLRLNTSSHQMNPRIQRVIAFMEQKPDCRLTLAALARIAGWSSSRLRHKFKSEVGVTPTAYLQMLRLCKARKLLTAGKLTVKEVKASVGITSDSYFTQEFKRVFGIPPSRSKLGLSNGWCKS